MAVAIPIATLPPVKVGAGDTARTTQTETAAASSVTNDRGQIEAQNDLTIRADTLSNQGATPAIQSSSFSDAIPYHVNGCPGAGCVQAMLDPGVVDELGAYTTLPIPLLSAYGEQVYNSGWGFRVATVPSNRPTRPTPP